MIFKNFALQEITSDFKIKAKDSNDHKIWITKTITEWNTGLKKSPFKDIVESQSIFNSAPNYTEQVENSCWYGATKPIYFYVILVFWLWCAVCRLLVSWPEREPAPPALAAWSLKHWTTRVFLSLVIPSSKLIHGFCYLELCKED